MKNNDRFLAFMEMQRNYLHDSMKRYADQLPNLLGIGELFIIKMPEPKAIVWCAVFPNPKDKHLWFCVPGDAFPLAGNRDVAVENIQHLEPHTFRTALGIWIHDSDIQRNNRFDKLDASSIEKIAGKIQDYFKSPAVTIANDEMMEDPDYEEWMDDLVFSIGLMRDQLHDDVDEPMIVSLRHDNDAEAINVYGSYQLAAADNDMEFDPSEPKFLSKTQIAEFETGILVAQRYEDGVIFEWHPSERIEHDTADGIPELFALGEKIEWQRFDSGLHSDLLSWSDDQVSIYINHRLMIIRKMEDA